MNVNNNTTKEEIINAEAIELICIDFDDDKYYYPIVETKIKVFVSDVNGTAQMKTKDYVRNMNKQKLYIGDDGQIYPQFRLIINDIK